MFRSWLLPKKTNIIFSPSPSLSAETIANHEDLLIQILLFLPLKSLFRFKCVSRHWLSLISRPLFTRHHNLSDSPCALFVPKWPRPDREVPLFHFIKLDSNHFDAPFRALTFANDPSAVKILQSCNGLLLCCSYHAYGSETAYYIYNPTTKQYKTLPQLSQYGEIENLYLAFDPSKSHHYKVICLRLIDIEDTDYQIEIYSSNTGLWKVSTEVFPSEYDVGFDGGVFWKSAIHWYTDSGPSIYFDVDQEQIKEMPMPRMPEDWDRRRVKYFGQSRGHLYLVEIYHSPSKQFNVCEMEEDYSGWSVKYRVDLDGVVSSYPEMIRWYIEPSALNYYIFQIMCIVRGDGDEDSYLVLHLPGKIIRYNLMDASFKELCGSAPCNPITTFTDYDVYEYIKSVARLW